MDFVSARLADGRWVRMLTMLDVYTQNPWRWWRITL
jgi:hypothetical protein